MKRKADRSRARPRKPTISVDRRSRRHRALRHRDRRRLPRPHAGAARAPFADRHDGQGQGRPAHRRPPHDRGYRHRARPGDRQGARRQARHHALRLDRSAHGRDADARRRSTSPAGLPGLERRLLARRRSARWTPNCCASSSRRSRRMPASRCMSTTSMARTTTTSPRPASRRWRGRFAHGARASIRARRAACPRPRAAVAALDSASTGGRRWPPITVHEPPPAARRSTRRATGVVFVQGRLLLAGLLVPPLWLLWHRLWIELALYARGLGCCSAFLGRCGARPAGVRWRSLAVHVLVGFEASDCARPRWTAWLARCRRRSTGRTRRRRAPLLRRLAAERPATRRRVRAPSSRRRHQRRCRRRRGGLLARRSRRHRLEPRRPVTHHERVAIIDYGSGNLRSAAKAFERAAREAGVDAEIEVTAEPERRAPRRPHRAARRRRLCRLQARPRRRARHDARRSSERSRRRAGRSSASASACS